MDLISKKDVGRLAETRQTQCVSIYLPTERAGREVRQNPIRFKNVLGKAEEQLAERNMSEESIRDLLKPVREMLDDEDYWQHQCDGLALFLTAELFQRYRLPTAFPELAVVTDRFHLKPLLPLITMDGKFYVLALSQNEVRVLQGSRHSVSELDIADVPESLAEALKYDDPEKSLQFRQGVLKRGKVVRRGKAVPRSFTVMAPVTMSRKRGCCAFSRRSTAVCRISSRLRTHR